MELKNSILEKIASLYGLLSKIDKYWTKAEITKSIKAYNSMELEVRVYTFLEEDGEEEKRLAYIIKEKNKSNGINYRTRFGLLDRRCKKNNCFKRRGGNQMPNKLDKCYYWHIITLAIMKNKIRKLGGNSNV